MPVFLTHHSIIPTFHYSSYWYAPNDAIIRQSNHRCQISTQLLLLTTEESKIYLREKEIP